MRDSLANQLAAIKSAIVASHRRRRGEHGETCGKHGHKSPGAARAQLRSLLRQHEAGNQRLISPDTLGVYECHNRECRRTGEYWHVGHVTARDESSRR